MAFRSMRFDRASGSAWNDFSDVRDSPWRGIVAGAAIFLMIGAIAGWLIIGSKEEYASERDPVTLCLLHGQTPKAELTLLDQTDALAADAGQHFTRLIGHIRDTLPRNGRLTIVPFGGDLGQPLDVAFDICSPGRGAEANQLAEGSARLQRTYDAKFSGPLNAVAASLVTPRESDQSPIAAQILRATNDPSINWQGEERVLNLLTDGLENTPESHIYRGGAVHLPPPPPDLLRGVTVNYFELTSAKHHELQTVAVRAAWKAWFEAAGAKVNLYAPGFAAPVWERP